MSSMIEIVQQFKARCFKCISCGEDQRAKYVCKCCNGHICPQCSYTIVHEGLILFFCKPCSNIYRFTISLDDNVHSEIDCSICKIINK